MISDRPLIAIAPYFLEGDVPALKLANRYADSILKCGGLPMVLAPVGGPVDLGRLLDRVDGLVLSGGDDFDTERLGLGPTHEAATPTPAVKQDWDFELARAAIERNLPTLGICYGMQVLGLAAGETTFLQHLPEDRPGTQNHSGNVEHAVRIAEGSKLAALVGVGELNVISQHHQALGSVTAPWTVVARDEEGLVEAIEHDENSFCFGVQWHPEKSPEGSLNQRLFRGLVDAAGMAAQRRRIALETK